MYHIIWFLFIFDRLPEMTGENTEQREEYLTRTDRKSIADKGNLKVVPAEIWKWLREILFEEQRKSRCEEKYDWLSSSCVGCSNTDTANTPIRGRGRKGCMCVKGLLFLLSSSPLSIIKHSEEYMKGPSDHITSLRDFCKFCCCFFLFSTANKRR